jgi:predicted negative regulator of RcsB-dependent stress response
MIPLYYSERGHKRKGLLVRFLGGLVLGFLVLWLAGAIVGAFRGDAVDPDELLESIEGGEGDAADLEAVSERLEQLADKHADSPIYPTLLARLARTYNRQDAPAKEAEVWRRMVRDCPQSPYFFEAVMKASEKFEEAGRLDAAARVLDEGITLSEGSPRALMQLRLARMTWRNGDPELARRYAESLLKGIESGDRVTWVNPAAGRLHLLMARMLTQEGRGREARRHLQKASDYTYPYDESLRRRIDRMEERLQ